LRTAIELDVFTAIGNSTAVVSRSHSDAPPQNVEYERSATI
jgi:hypothetical protein